MTDMDSIREVIRTAKVFSLSLADLERAAAYCESVAEFERVVNEMAVASDG